MSKPYRMRNLNCHDNAYYILQDEENDNEIRAKTRFRQNLELFMNYRNTNSKKVIFMICLKKL